MYCCTACTYNVHTGTVYDLAKHHVAAHEGNPVLSVVVSYCYKSGEKASLMTSYYTNL